MEAEKLERFKRTVLSDKELYVAFSDVQMRYKSVIEFFFREEEKNKHSIV